MPLVTSQAYDANRICWYIGKREWWLVRFFRHGDGDIDVSDIQSTSTKPGHYDDPQNVLFYFPRRLYPKREDLPRRRREIKIHPWL